MEKQLTVNTNFWWLQMLLGVLFISFGLWFWFTPIETYITLAIFFSVWMFVTGIFEIINAIGGKKQSKQWGVYLISGIVDLVIGLVLMNHQSLTMEILPIFLGFWLLFRAIMLLVMYFELKGTSKGTSKFLIFSAIFSVLFSLLILAKPVVGDLVIVYATSFAFFFIGMYRLILGNTLRKLRQK